MEVMEVMDSKQYQKLKEEIKENIRNAFRVYSNKKIPEEALVKLCADHAIGLLQLPKETQQSWYEDDNDQS